MAHDITHPDYYNDKSITPIDYIHANNLNFDEGSIIKYITRHKGKNGKDDVIKAAVYCFFVLQHQYKLTPSEMSDVIEKLDVKFGEDI